MRPVPALLLMSVLAITALVSSTAGASATPARTPYTAAVTEEFCGPGVTCGTAVGNFGPATVSSVITYFAWVPASGCFSDHHTSTLSFSDGSQLVLAVVGELCPTRGGNFTFSGSYAVAGESTGLFSGATGSGSVQALRENGPIHAVFQGSIALAP